MKRLLLAGLAILLSLGIAQAGPNSNGAIIVHTNDSYNYSAATICTTTLGTPWSCADAITQSNKNWVTAGQRSTVWFLAAFPPLASPRVATVYFGTDVDEVNLDAGTNYGYCGPTGTQQIADATWPYDAGNSVSFGIPILGNTFFRFYAFGLNNYDDDPAAPNPWWCSTINPTGGHAAFFDDALPPNQDDITQFGCVKWYEVGYNDCPVEEPAGACCAPDGTCTMTYATGCILPSVWHSEWASCAPNNCPQPEAACCDLLTGICTVTVAANCLSPLVWHPEHTSCSPNPCLIQRACCSPEGVCRLTEMDGCIPPDTWHADTSYCEPNPCFPPGPNLDGAIIVHTNDAYTYSSDTICSTDLGAPASCGTAITRTDKSAGAIVWFLAAFGSGSVPRVTGVSFGISFDEVNLNPVRIGPCGPAPVVELPDYGWPSATAGDRVEFGTPVIGNTLFRFYYFEIDDYSGGPPAAPFLCSAAHSAGGYAAFLDDSSPPAEDRITRFGCVGWYSNGSNDCPEGGSVGACCFTDGHCEILEEAACLASPEHDAWLGAGSACGPENPCLSPLGACCDPGTGECTYVVESACAPPLVWHTEWTCQPNYCPPPIRTEETTWGKIKASFR